MGTWRIHDRDTGGGTSTDGMPIMSNSWIRTARFVAVAVPIVVCWPALADTVRCRELQAEFAAAPAPGYSPEYREYSQAVATQREQIMIARRRAQDAGCGFYSKADRPTCSPIAAQIDKMERNLASLQHRQAEIAREERRRPDRTRLLAALNANNCGDPRLVGEQPPQPQPAQLSRVPHASENGRETVETLPTELPSGTRHAPDREEPVVDAGDPAAKPARNFRVIAGNPPDADVLATQPIAEPRPSITYAAPARTGSDRVSETELPGEMERDFKEVMPPEPPLESPALSEGDAGEITEQGSDTAPVHSAAPHPVGEPAPAPSAPSEAGTILEASRTEPASAGTNETEAPSHAAPETVLHELGQRKVRVVGPTFLPDPEAAIDLRAPARNQAR